MNTLAIELFESAMNMIGVVVMIGGFVGLCRYTAKIWRIDRILREMEKNKMIDIPQHESHPSKSMVSLYGHIMNHWKGEGIYRMPNNMQYYAYLHKGELILKSLKWYRNG